MSDLRPDQQVRLTFDIRGKVVQNAPGSFLILDPDGLLWDPKMGTVEVLPTTCPAQTTIFGVSHPCEVPTSGNGTHLGSHVYMDAEEGWTLKWPQKFTVPDDEDEWVRRGPFVPTGGDARYVLKRLVENAQMQQGSVPPVIAPTDVGTVVEAATDYNESAKKRRELFVLVGNEWVDEDGDGHAWDNLVVPIVRHFGWDRTVPPRLPVHDGVQAALRRFEEAAKKPPRIPRPEGVGAIVRAAMVLEGWGVDHGPGETIKFDAETRWFQDHGGGWTEINGHWEGADWDDLIDPVLEQPGVKPEREVRAT